MKKIVFSNADGSVTFVVPVVTPGETEDAAVQREAARTDVVPEGASYEIVSDDLPPREDRDGWELRDGRIQVRAGWVRPSEPTQ